MAVGKDIAEFEGGAGERAEFVSPAGGSCCRCYKKARNRVASCCCCGDIGSSPGWLKRRKGGLEGMVKGDVSEEKKF